MRISLCEMYGSNNHMLFIGSTFCGNFIFSMTKRAPVYAVHSADTGVENMEESVTVE